MFVPIIVIRNNFIKSIFKQKEKLSMTRSITKRDVDPVIRTI